MRIACVTVYMRRTIPRADRLGLAELELERQAHRRTAVHLQRCDSRGIVISGHTRHPGLDLSGLDLTGPGLGGLGLTGLGLAGLVLSWLGLAALGGWAALGWRVGHAVHIHMPTWHWHAGARGLGWHRKAQAAHSVAGCVHSGNGRE